MGGDRVGVLVEGLRILGLRPLRKFVRGACDGVTTYGDRTVRCPVEERPEGPARRLVPHVPFCLFRELREGDGGPGGRDCGEDDVAECVTGHQLRGGEGADADR